MERYVYFIFYAIFIFIFIYLLVMVRKNKSKIFDGKTEPELAEKRYKILKVFLMVAGMSLAVGIVGVIAYNLIYGLCETEEPVTFFIGVVGIFVFIIATIGGLVMFIIGRRKAISKHTEKSTT